jgi:N-hydroxyarylamine O-acetyltransferase
MNFSQYLERIDLAGVSVRTDAAALRDLQRSHLLSVPFENLDIHWNRPITLDPAAFFEKIVVERRGGFCYELNGLFNELLCQIGFRTRLISARVFNGTTHGPEFDHAAIIVTIGNEEYLADVGFGAFTAEPLLFVMDVEQHDANGAFVIRRREDDGFFEVMKRDDGVWRSEYVFNDIERELSEFAVMCDYQQYDPRSHFRKGKLCSLMTERGRKTLTETSFIVTSNGRKTEFAVESDAGFYEILNREFLIDRDRYSQALG